MGDTWWPTPDGGLEYFHHVDEQSGVRWSPFRCNEVMRGRPWDTVESFYDCISAGESFLGDLQLLSLDAPFQVKAGDRGSKSDGQEAPRLNKSPVDPRTSESDGSEALSSCEATVGFPMASMNAPDDRSDGGESPRNREAPTGSPTALVDPSGKQSDGRGATVGSLTSSVNSGGKRSDGGETRRESGATVRSSKGLAASREKRLEGGETKGLLGATVGCPGGSTRQLERRTLQASLRKERIEDLQSSGSNGRNSDTDGSEASIRQESKRESRDLKSDGWEGAGITGASRSDGWEATGTTGASKSDGREAAGTTGDGREAAGTTGASEGKSDKQLERRNFKIQLAYSGRHFWGWQKQTGHGTVQDALERALRSVLDKRETRPGGAPGRYLAEPLTVEASRAKSGGIRQQLDSKGAEVAQVSSNGLADENGKAVSLDTCHKAGGTELGKVNEPETKGKDWDGTEWNGTDWNGTDWDGTEWSERDWNGTDWNGTESYGTERGGSSGEECRQGKAVGTERNGTEWNGAERNGTHQNGTERNGLERNGIPEKDVTEGSGTVATNGPVGAAGPVEMDGSEPVETVGMQQSKSAESDEPVGVNRPVERNENGTVERDGTAETNGPVGTAEPVEMDVGGHERLRLDAVESTSNGSERIPVSEMDGTGCLQLIPETEISAVRSLPERSGKRAAKRDARKKAPVETTNASVAGRTDRGVSAAGQVVSWYTRYMDVDCDEIADAINREAPGKLRAVRVTPVSRSFHAQFSAKWRSYVYLFPLKGGELQPDGSLRIHPPGMAAPHQPRGFVNVIPPSVFRVTLLDEMLRQLEGRSISYGSYARDTRPDRSSGQPVVCHVFKARADVVTVTSPEGDPSERSHALRFCLVGNRFLHRMVRVIVATTIREAAAGSPSDALLRLAFLECRRATAPPAPPQGLTLVKVGYADYPST